MNNITHSSNYLDTDVMVAEEGIPQQFYSSIFNLIDNLDRKDEFNGDSNLYGETKNLIANFVYFIYEKFELNGAREIDYQLIRKWAAQNKTLAEYLLLNYYPSFRLDSFRKWIQPPVPITAMGLYDRSDIKTKDTFH